MSDAMDLIRLVAENPDASLDEMGVAFMRLALAKGTIDPASFDMDAAAKCLEAIAAIKVAGGGSGQDEILRGWVALGSAHELTASRVAASRGNTGAADADSHGPPGDGAGASGSVDGGRSGLDDSERSQEPGDTAGVFEGASG